MTYAELGYLRAVHAVLAHECATKEEQDQAQHIFVAVCARLQIGAETAEMFCEALEE